MSAPLQVLMVEDLAADAELLAAKLEEEDFQPHWTRVETEAEYVTQLGREWDVILADFSLPGFSAERALKIVQEKALDAPFIIVSGTIGDERAVEVVKAGATDYVLKDRLDRLGPVVRRALRERNERRRRLEADEELRKSQEEFRQAQKMESIGQLAGGIAHDFNNILTVIQGHASLLLTTENCAQPILDSAEEISLAAERAARLTRQLLTFSRKQIAQPRWLDLTDIIGDLTKMLKRILGEDVALEVHCDSRLSLAHADAGMMEQVLMNLAVNARDAMPQGGKLRIAARDEVIDENYARLHPQGRVGRHVCLAVADTGSGIPPEVLPRIFEPFFTTKPVGKGTGLGLATVYGIVRQHQGWITVTSVAGAGTEFRIYLPAGAGAEQRPAEGAISQEAPHGYETILLVEDEPSVRLLGARILERHGYKVIEAESGPAALEIWKERKESIDLLLTDIVMPGGLSGLELAKWIHQEKPNLPILYTTGYSVEIVSQSVALDSIALLQKPYTASKLAQAVRASLDRAGQRR
jgi:signal transduction histidine kinase